MTNTKLNFEYKNLRVSTRDWASAYHVDCDIYLNGEFITVYTYNPWWKIEDKKQIQKSFGWGYESFFGQHFFGKRLTDVAAKKKRDEILKNLRGAFPYIIQPERADVIDCLGLDSMALDYSFSEWCANFGEDSDSISALETYNECCKIGRKLVKMGIYNELKQEWEKNNE